MASIYLNKNVVPDESTERNVLKAILEAGAVDGITKRSEESIDNIAIDEHICLLSKVRSLVAEQIK